LLGGEAQNGERTDLRGLPTLDFLPAIGGERKGRSHGRWRGVPNQRQVRDRARNVGDLGSAAIAEAGSAIGLNLRARPRRTEDDDVLETERFRIESVAMTRECEVDRRQGGRGDLQGEGDPNRPAAQPSLSAVLCSTNPHAQLPASRRASRASVLWHGSLVRSIRSYLPIIWSERRPTPAPIREQLQHPTRRERGMRASSMPRPRTSQPSQVAWRRPCLRPDAEEHQGDRSPAASAGGCSRLSLRRALGCRIDFDRKLGFDSLVCSAIEPHAKCIGPRQCESQREEVNSVV
jgi:hypothetical protein